MYPLSSFFLSGYLSKNRSDLANFPDHEFPAGFERYERVFECVLQVLGLSKEALKSKPEFNFDSGDAANLEGGVAVLRVIEALRIADVVNIALVRPKKNSRGADITGEKCGQRVCLEVKTITKQSSGREGLFLEEQLYEKILESIPSAKQQLGATAAELHCAVKIYVCVVNWFPQSIHLALDDLQQIVDRLERDGDQESLKGIDGVWFIMGMGTRFLFLNEIGKSIEC